MALPVSIQGLDKQPSQTPTPVATSQSTSTPDGTVAAYMGPDQGPFRCGSCQYFTDQDAGCNKPEVVQELGDRGDGQAQVDAEGCCNFYEKR